MKKILGVVGSPRRNGNTHILVSTILHGAKEKGAETDIVLLGEMRIQECDGCHACWKARQCRKNDDMNFLYEKLAQSDVIVFGTPVYWYGPTALMKAFIDRFVYFNCSRNREKISGKGAVIAVPFEEKNIETASGVVDFFEKCFQYLEMKSVARIIVPEVTRRGEIRKRPDQIQSALEIGRSLGMIRDNRDLRPESLANCGTGLTSCGTPELETKVAGRLPGRGRPGSISHLHQGEKVSTWNQDGTLRFGVPSQG